MLEKIPFFKSNNKNHNRKKVGFTRRTRPNNNKKQNTKKTSTNNEDTKPISISPSKPLYAIDKKIIDKHIDNVMGRPTKYKPCMCKQAIELMSQGMSKTQVAVRLGIDLTTLRDWIDSESDRFRPDFSIAIKRGEILSEDWWVEVGRTNIFNKDFNTGMYMIQMANRFNWSRRDRLEVDAKLEKKETKEINLNFNYNGEEAKEIAQILISHGIVKSDDIKLAPEAEIN